MKKLLLLLIIPLFSFGQIHEFNTYKNINIIANGKLINKVNNTSYWFWISSSLVNKSKSTKHSTASTKYKYWFNEDWNYTDKEGRQHFIREDKQGKFILDLVSLEPKVIEIWWDVNQKVLKQTNYYIKE